MNEQKSYPYILSVMNKPILMKKITTRRSKNQKFASGDQIDGGHNMVDYTEKLNSNEFPNCENITLLSVIMPFISMVSFIFDVGSDIYLIITYYKQDNFAWYLLTMSFVLFPALIMTIFSVIWYWSDNECKFSYIGWIIRMSLHLILLAPLVRYIDTIIYTWKAKWSTDKIDKTKFYRKMIYEEADSSLLRVMECSMESTPQLLLQLYILFTQSQVKTQPVIILQILCILFSLISLSWCLASYQSSLRLVTPGKIQMQWNSITMMIIWKVLVIIPRFLSISLFTSVYKLYILIAFAAHYILMSIYIICQKTTFFSPKRFTFKEIIFNLVMAAIYCVDFLNLTDGRTRYKCLFYYGVSFAEITTLIILWFYRSPFDQGENFSSTNLSLLSFNHSNNSTIYYYYQNWSTPVRKLILLEILTCFLIGVMLMVVYFLKFHPTQNIKIFSKVSLNATNQTGDRLLAPIDSHPSSSSK